MCECTFVRFYYSTSRTKSKQVFTKRFWRREFFAQGDGFHSFTGNNDSKPKLFAKVPLFMAQKTYAEDCSTHLLFFSKIRRGLQIFCGSFTEIRANKLKKKNESGHGVPLWHGERLLQGFIVVCRGREWYNGSEKNRMKRNCYKDR